MNCANSRNLVYGLGRGVSPPCMGEAREGERPVRPIEANRCLPCPSHWVGTAASRASTSEAASAHPALSPFIAGFHQKDHLLSRLPGTAPTHWSQRKHWLNDHCNETAYNLSLVLDYVKYCNPVQSLQILGLCSTLQIFTVIVNNLCKFCRK